MGFPCGSAHQESACNAGNLGLIPGLGRSPGVGKDYTLQYFGLEISMGCTVQGVAKSQTGLRDFHFHSTHALYSVAFLGDIRKVLSLNSNTWWQKTGIRGLPVGIDKPTPILLPGKSHGWRSLVGCSPWGCEESDMTEWLHFHFSLSCIGEGNGNPLQCSCLENPRDGGAWWAAVYGVAQIRTRLKRLSSSSSSMFHEPSLPYATQ